MKSRDKSMLYGLFLWFYIMAVQSISAAPITFNTALPAAKGEFINREQVVLVRSGSDPSSLQRDMQG